MMKQRLRALSIGYTLMNMNINSVMIGKKKALPQSLWVVERTKKRGNPF